MNKVLLILCAVLFTCCSSESHIDGIWENEFGIIKFDSKKGSYEGIAINGTNFSQSLTVDAEDEGIISFTTDGTTFDASVSENRLTITNSEGRDFEYDRYNNDIYSENKYKNILDGKWNATYMLIELTYFFDTDNNEMEVFGMGESSKADFTIERIIGNWCCLKTGEETLVIALKDDNSFVMKIEDSSAMLFTRQ